MANASWPASLPAYVLTDGFSSKPGVKKIETAMEAGRPKSRQRFTTMWRQFNVMVKMTPSQKVTFDTFYETTLASGTLPFDWVHPQTRVAATFKFRNPPPEDTYPDGFNPVVAMALEQIA